MDKNGHPYYPDGKPYKNWDYSKPFIPALTGVPPTTPPMAEVGEIELTAFDLAAIKRAEEKRKRKEMKKRMNNLAGMISAEFPNEK